MNGQAGLCVGPCSNAGSAGDLGQPLNGSELPPPGFLAIRGGLVKARNDSSQVRRDQVAAPTCASREEAVVMVAAREAVNGNALILVVERDPHVRTLETATTASGIAVE